MEYNATVILYIDEFQYDTDEEAKEAFGEWLDTLCAIAPSGFTFSTLDCFIKNGDVRI